ncbi:MAG: acyl-ACP--UDP-N-acetylglucosamine O-acyltransferase [Thermodesulfobacteriota bacterium]
MSEVVTKIKDVKIDPTALVHATAEMDSGVTIGPYTVIGEGVRIGKNTNIHSHVLIDKWTTIGADCEIFQFTSIGAPPQDMGYKGEKTQLILGDRNVVREFVTMHRATTKEEGKTICGSDNLFMNYVHVAHDCVIGNHVVMANAATLAGHVYIDDYAIVGGLVAVHQHVRIGAHCIIGGASAVSKDVPPFVMAVGNRAKLYRLNSVGLRRQGFSKDDISEIKTAYKILFKSSLKLKDAIEKLKEDLPGSEHARAFLEFFKNSKRGVIRVKSKKKGDGHEED